ncbi:MAG: hypothetical protein GXO87_12515 [Chlorobi bacterium]|nr:hypothetical protein [Chlorobiota bacterium]
MIKKIFILLFLLVNAAFSQMLKLGEAKGLFMSVATGPRFPVGALASTHTYGVGFDFGFSYGDNKIVPVFFYAKVGYQNFQGSQDYYRKSDHSGISTDMIYFNGGIRYYFPPVIKQFMIVMPVVDAGLMFAYSETLHQYRLEFQKNSVYEDEPKFGFQIGGGVSMFILDVLAYYNYLPKSQFISVEIRARVPIFVNY